MLSIVAKKTSVLTMQINNSDKRKRENEDLLSFHSLTNTHRHTHKHTNTHVCTQIHARTHTHTYTHTHTHTQTHYSPYAFKKSLTLSWGAIYLERGGIEKNLYQIQTNYRASYLKLVSTYLQKMNYFWIKAVRKILSKGHYTLDIFACNIAILR